MTDSSSENQGSTPAPYWNRSRRPLEMLAFLFPLVVIYELGLAFVLPEGDGGTGILAYVVLEQTFVALGLGAAGMALPGILIIVALLVQQVLSRASWTLHLPTLLVMAVESLALTVPLLIFGAAVMTAAPSVVVAVVDEASAPDLASRLVLAVGAGLYEELVFRWALIVVLHFVLADLLKVSARRATVIAVFVSSLIFMAAHFLGQPFDLRAAVFFFVAGIYFAAAFVVRGFGIAAGTHALYDVVVELLAS